jgi:PAS domain S-box-containing protein
MRFEPAPIPVEEMERVALLHQFQILDTDREESFDRLTRLASLITGAPIALISLVDADRQWFKSRHGLEAEQTSRDISFCGHAILTDEITVIPDAAVDDRFADNPLVTGDPFIRFYAGVPLIAREGYRLGTLCVIDTEPRVGLSSIETEGLLALSRTVMDEIELRLTAMTLREQTKELTRYYEVMGASTDFLGLASADGTVIGVNPAGRRLTGYASTEDLHSLNLASFHPPEVEEMLWNHAIPVAARTGSWRGESLLRTKQGELIPVEQIVLVHRGESGAVEFLSTICRDLSERDEINRLRQLQLMKDTFVSTVSHELRTPLTSISVSLAMFTDGLLGELDEESMRVLRIARSNSERLTQLVDDILDLERTELGSRVLKFERIPISELIAPALLQLEGHLAAAGARVSTEIEVDEGFRIMCAPDRIIRVLVNLLTNAIKYSGIGATIILRVEAAADDMLTFSVVDNGIGIREESIPHLFDPFWQVDSSPSRTVQGSGLGLAIARRIVERHGGFFEVESTFGEGSTFSFTIPIA